MVDSSSYAGLSLTPYRLSHAWFCLVICGSFAYLWLHQDVEHSYNIEPQVERAIYNMRSVFKEDIASVMRDRAVALLQDDGKNHQEMLEWIQRTKDTDIRVHHKLDAHITFSAGPNDLSNAYLEELTEALGGIQEAWRLTFGARLSVTSNRVAHVRVSDRAPTQRVVNGSKISVYTTEEVADFEQINAGWLPNAGEGNPATFHFVVLVPGLHCRPLYFVSEGNASDELKMVAHLKGFGALRLCNSVPVNTSLILNSFVKSLMTHTVGNPIPGLMQIISSEQERNSTVYVPVEERGSAQIDSSYSGPEHKEKTAFKKLILGVLLQSVQDNLLDAINLLRTSKGDVIDDDPEFWTKLDRILERLGTFYVGDRNPKDTVPVEASAQLLRSVQGWKREIRRRSYAPVDYFLSVYLPPWMPLLLALVLSLFSLYPWKNITSRST
eukprot:gb/GECG01006947.1/.p1 GENE.gb/GECG01006947.1/~~gb/GECG01006947.1/.p1  ORF type:complete len:439 (+),score=43.57 gb/GECG01006947.1/:1-1317(+)